MEGLVMMMLLMARNANANVDILYYSIDEIRLRLISDLQDYMNIHERLCITVYEEAKAKIQFAQLWMVAGSWSLSIGDKYSNFES